jgi:[ribosomal protein S5]-alanine N-acetyltransferase
MIEISTPRLRLIPLDLRSLRLLKESRAKLQLHLGLEHSEIQMEDIYKKELEEAMEWWIIQVAAHPKHYMWFTNWEIVLKAENRSIGSIGLAGQPDKHGETTTGYVIDRRYHNQGYATESLKALARWVFRDASAKRLLADTPKENHVSQAVLRKCGFRLDREEGKMLHWALGKKELLKQDLQD